MRCDHYHQEDNHGIGYLSIYGPFVKSFFFFVNVALQVTQKKYVFHLSIKQHWSIIIIIIIIISYVNMGNCLVANLYICCYCCQLVF